MSFAIDGPEHDPEPAEGEGTDHAPWRPRPDDHLVEPFFGGLSVEPSPSEVGPSEVDPVADPDPIDARDQRPQPIKPVRRPDRPRMGWITPCP